MEEEQKWIRDIQRRGSRQAADKLVRAYYDEMYRFAYRQLGRKEDALDLTQTIFLAVLRALPAAAQGDSVDCGAVLGAGALGDDGSGTVFRLDGPAHRPAGNGVSLRRSGRSGGAGPVRLDLLAAAAAGTDGVNYALPYKLAHPAKGRKRV